MEVSSKKKKIIFISISAIMIVFMSTFTYAFFTANVKNDAPKVVSVKSGTMTLEFTDVGEGNAVDENFTIGSTKTKKLVLNNTGTLPATVQIYWKDLINTHLSGSLSYTLEQSTEENGEYIKVDTISNNVPRSESLSTKPLSKSITIPAQTKYYYILTVSYNHYDNIDQSQDDNAILATAFTLSDKLTNNIDEIIANADENTPDFSTVATTDEGIFTMLDDDGTSYYYRGAVDNNYVKFGTYGNVYRGYDTETITPTSNFVDYDTLEACQSATTYNFICESMQGKDMYWRIIRVNGNGSLRMIYDGTRPYENGVANTDRLALTKTKWNAKNGDAKYAGYMYSPANLEDGTAVASKSKEEAQTNLVPASVKTSLEKWYEQNFKGTVYDTNYISDEVFCNDRSTPHATNNKGFAKNLTYYGARERLLTNKKPTFKCDMNDISLTTSLESDNDKFTVGNEKGNGKLNYKVGMITADEAAAAGGVYGSANKNESYYLYKGVAYWSFSPFSTSTTGTTHVFRVDSTGNLMYTSVTDTVGGVAPVINLNAESATKLVGSGTITDPYRLS